MKRVLIISFYFPPSKMVGGKRTSRFRKYLKNFGWETVILTINKPKAEKGGPFSQNNGRDAGVYRAYFWDISFIVKFIGGVFNKILKLFNKELPGAFIKDKFIFPDLEVTWTLPCFFKALKIIKKENIDLIFVSCKPVSAAFTGLFLKFLTGKKLIIEFRDPWALDPYRKRAKIIQKLCEAAEKLLLKYSDAFIVVTEGTQKIYQRKYPNINIVNIPNTYDEEDVLPDSIIKNDNNFIILYYGSIYGGRDIDKIAKIVDEINMPRIKFGFAGTAEQKVLNRLRNYKSSIYFGFISSQERIGLLNKSAMLYLNNIRVRDRGIANPFVGAKTYEYLASGIPILADLEDGDELEIVKRYATEYYSISNITPEEIKNIVLNVYKKWGQSELKRIVNPDFIKEYEPGLITQHLARIFDEVMSIKILHIVHTFEVGGLEKGIVGLINSLNREKFQHSLCCISKLGRMRNEIIRKDIKFFELGENIGHSLRVLCKLFCLFRKERPDIILTYNWGAIDAILPAKLAGIRAVIHGEYGIGLEEDLAGHKRRIWFRRFVFKFTDKIIVVAKESERILIKQLKINKNKVFYLPYGIDTGYYSNLKTNLRKKYLIPENEFVIGNVGNFRAVKDHLTLLKAFAKASSLIPNSRLIIAGNIIEQDYFNQLQEYVDRLNIRKGVLFLQGIIASPELYNTFDIFVLSSKSEKTPNVILEAAACGLPIITTNVGDIGTNILDENSAIFFKPGDDQALFEGIKYFYENRGRGRGKEFGLRAQTIVSKKFALQKMLSEYEKLLSC